MLVGSRAVYFFLEKVYDKARMAVIRLPKPIIKLTASYGVIRITSSLAWIRLQDCRYANRLLS